MISVEVKYRNPNNGELTTDDEIHRIFVASETEYAVIIHLETKTKRPCPLMYGMSHVAFLTAKCNVAEVWVHGLPSFETPVAMAEASRYGMFVIFFHEVPEDGRQIYPNKEPKV